ncbi:MAG: hypothetical protein NZM42_14395 [Gemmatales bacterium]|nr:hypothetical protein [Gemmatales bacterium]
MSAVRIMLAAVHRVSAYVRGLSFEAFGDLAMSLCIGLGLTLLALGSLATPDYPALWADEEFVVAPTPECRGPEECDLTRCTVQLHPCSEERADCKPGIQCDLCKCVWNSICGCYYP